MSERKKNKRAAVDNASAAEQKAEIERKRQAAKIEQKARKRAELEHKKRRAEAEREKKARQAEAERKRKQAIAAERLKRRQVVYAKIKNALKNRKSGFYGENKGIHPRVELEVRGDVTSALTRLASSGIAATDVRKTGGGTLFKIRKKDLSKAIAILSEMCYTYRINAAFGIGKSLAFWAARAGLLIGAAASAIGLNIAYGYVWRVEIDGNTGISDAAIYAELKKNGIKSGSKKSGGLAGSAAAVLEGYDGISDASCEVRGTTLYVHVLESAEHFAPPRYAGYTARYDATVTRIVVRSGTALVERGDVVKRGQALISGDVYSTTGELLYSELCDGEVYGTVSVECVANIPAVGVRYKRTGRSSVKTVFSIFGKALGKAKSPYRSYELASHTSNYDLLLPLYATSYTYYETVAEEYERDLAEAVKAYAEQRIADMYFNGDFTYTYNVTEQEHGMYGVHLFISGEAVISQGNN